MTTLEQTRFAVGSEAKATQAVARAGDGEPGSAAASSVPRLIATADDRGALIARLVLGAVMLPHGMQHAMGWLGGYGFSGTLQWMTHTLGFPAPLAALAIVIEVVAPLALVAGVGGRLAALGLFGLMLGALKTHLANGFFMNWFGTLPAGGEGFEYHLLALALAGVVMVRGSGALSLDRWFERRSLFGKANDPS